MKTQENNQRIVYYRRYSKIGSKHFTPAPGYNCPRIPLGSVNSKGPDYECVRVVKSENCDLNGRAIMISWGLNLPRSKWSKIKQVIAIDVETSNATASEIVLAVGC